MTTLRANIKSRNIFVPATLMPVLAGLGILSTVAYGTAYTQLDLRISEWAQSLDFFGLSATASFVNGLTDAPMAIALWLVFTAFFVLKGRPLEALTFFAISGVWVANEIIGVAVHREAPTGELGAVEFTRTVAGSFPSGHVAGAVVFYSMLGFLTFQNTHKGSPLRTAIVAIGIIVIAFSSFARIYVGAHWASDVLGSYLVGSAGVAIIGWFYLTVREDRLRVPRFLKRKPAEQIVSDIKMAGSIASKVELDFRNGTATKQYTPPLPVRMLYRLAFQAPFPYQGRRDALEAAAAKRRIAGLLTKHRYGSDMVAAVYDIEQDGDSYNFITELVPGSEPASNKEVEDILSDMYGYFQETGMPTWQISPANPHAYSNFIRTPEGELKLIDLESSLVSFSPPFKELRAALREGHYPVFDDVDFAQLLSFVNKYQGELTASLGKQDFNELNESIEVAEQRSEQWKHSEGRVWGRILTKVYHRLDFSGFIAKIRRTLENTESMAKAFMLSSVERWENEGRITGEKAAFLRERMNSSEVKMLVRHIGAHLALSIALRFPFGSIARFLWVLGFRVSARYRLAKGRITKEQYAQAKSIHALPVMMISLIPMLGTVSFLASGTVRNSGLARMLVDQFAYKLPFGAYRKLNLARVTAPSLPKVEKAVKSPSPIAKAGEKSSELIAGTTTFFQSIRQHFTSTKKCASC